MLHSGWCLRPDINCLRGQLSLQRIQKSLLMRDDMNKKGAFLFHCRGKLSRGIAVQMKLAAFVWNLRVTAEICCNKVSNACVWISQFIFFLYAQILRMLKAVYKKWINIVFIFGICKRNFSVVIAGFGLRFTFWRVVSGFYWNTQNSFTVAMQLGKCEMAWEVLDKAFASCDWAPFAHFVQIFVRNVTNLPVNVLLALFLNITFIGQTLATS